MTTLLGIDIGGSGIKGGIVDVNAGEMLGDRHRIPTPQPATPEACMDVIQQIQAHFAYSGPVGVAYPGVIQKGRTMTAANMHDGWVGFNAAEQIGAVTGGPVRMINDADAAGLAEASFGAGRGHTGVILIVTIGTGLGSSLVTDGELMPNTEFGHIIMANGKECEHYASDAVRKAEDLSWDEWGARFNEVLTYYHALLWPDLIILGGGASKKMKKYGHQLDVPTEIVPAELRNQAGIVGAAAYAARLYAG
jgi:polyphosphate glucokinase